LYITYIPFTIILLFVIIKNKGYKQLKIVELYTAQIKYVFGHYEKSIRSL